MPFAALQIQPGVNIQSTKLLGGNGFNSCQLIRFKDGLLQKLGGWARLISTPFAGVVRALLPFEDLDSNLYIGAGSDQRLYVYTAGQLYDITPIQQVDNLSAPFDTTISSDIITVLDASYNPLVGDWVYIVNPAAVDGLVLQGAYIVVSVPDGTHYTIQAASAATSSVTAAGTAALFTTISSSSIINVTLNNHGLSIGNPYTVYISTSVGGLTLFGVYSVAGIVDVNNFTFDAGTAASFSDFQSENGGNIRINYLLPSGQSSTTYSYGVYGTGNYGVGAYNVGQAASPIYLRYWSLAPWGQDMLASYNNGPLYFWDVTLGLINNPATLVATAPQKISACIFTAMPEQIVVACGSSIGTSAITDQLLVRWSNVSDYTDWVPTAVNQAGSFRIPTGSHIVGGIQGPQQGLIWTDIGLWVMQYIQPPLVFGFNEIAQGCGLYGPKAAAVLSGIVYWMSTFGFFMFDGNSVRALPCTVWDFIFKNINSNQWQKVIAAPNSSFNEISWFFPSLSGNGEIDSYVKYNALSNLWDYGVLVRTAWMDQSVWGPPIGVDDSKLMQQHEVSNNADGVAINSWAETGWLKIAEGTMYTFIERMIPDFIYSGSNTVILTVSTVNYPNDAPYTQAFNATVDTEYLVVRQRGRLVSLKIESNDLDSFWRIGQILYSGAPAGRN